MKSEKLSKRFQELESRERELVNEVSALEKRLVDLQAEGQDVKGIVRMLSECRIELESIPQAKRKVAEELLQAKLEETEAEFQGKEAAVKEKLAAIKTELQRLATTVKNSEAKILQTAEGLKFAHQGIEESLLMFSKHLSTGWTNIYNNIEASVLSSLRWDRDYAIHRVHEESKRTLDAIGG